MAEIHNHLSTQPLNRDDEDEEETDAGGKVGGSVGKSMKLNGEGERGMAGEGDKKKKKGCC